MADMESTPSPRRTCGETLTVISTPTRDFLKCLYVSMWFLTFVKISQETGSFRVGPWDQVLKDGISLYLS